MFILASLEDENKALKNEYLRLAQDTDDVEAQEARLLRDLTGQLSKCIFCLLFCCSVINLMTYFFSLCKFKYGIFGR